MSSLRLALTICLLGIILTACNYGDSSLFGKYEVRGGTARPATLTLVRPDRYTFCIDECASGRFKVREIDGAGGRISFTGTEISAYSRNLFSDSFGAEVANELRAAPTDSAEFSYELSSLLPPVIHIEAGSDVMFVKIE